MSGPPSPSGESVRRRLDQRADLLTALLERPLTKPELVERLDVSRSTVDRAVRDLRAASLVRTEGGTVVVTSVGRLGNDAAERYRRSISNVCRALDLLEPLPADTPLDPVLLSGATVHRPTSGPGRQALRAALSVVEGADTVYACSRAVTDTSAPAAAHRLVVDAEATLEVVYASNVAEYIRTNYPENHREMVATGRYRAFESPSVPFGLFVATSGGETHVAVACYDSDDTLVGVLTNDSDAAVAWAESTYRRFRERATEFTDEFAE